MASTSKGDQMDKTLSITNAGGDRVEEEAAVPLSVTQALQNDLVLDNIFSYLSVPDLKACRQVCQQWKQASRRSLAEKCNPVGFFGRSVVSRPGSQKIHRVEEMANLTSVISTSISSEFPVTKFMVDTNLITDAPPGNMDGLEKILREFFHAIGPLATQLEFGFMDAEKFLQLDAPLNVEFLRLKTLKACSVLPDYHPGHLIPKDLAFFQNILENAPQLSKLEIARTGSKTVELLINLLEHVVSKRKITIGTLLFQSGTSLFDIHYHRLANLGLKLTSLRLNLELISSLNKVGEGWMKFLESQSETLEELFVECYGWSLRPELTIGFPCLRKLKRLTIGSYSNTKFSGIFYTKQFPSLKQLSLNSNYNNIYEAFLNSGLPPVETVEILELPELYDPVWILHAARIFPNVKKLKINGKKETVQAVFQAWQNVEELTIRDMGWGGHSAYNLLAVNFAKAKFLQDLKTLRLEDFSYTYLPSNRIWQFVFLRMGSLKCLDLSKCRNPASLISASMLSKMRKKFLVLC